VADRHGKSGARHGTKLALPTLHDGIAVITIISPVIKRANSATAGKAAGGKQLAIGSMFISHVQCRINHIIIKPMLTKPLTDAKLRATLPAVASRL
jgi:hypothetical protein